MKYCKDQMTIHTVNTAHIIDQMRINAVNTVHINGTDEDIYRKHCIHQGRDEETYFK